MGIGITNQRETVVLWDRATLKPVAPAIVWQDRRTAGRCRELRSAGLEADIRARTGLVADPYFSATKLEWLLRDSELRWRAERGELLAGTVDTWLIARLTGGRVHATDRTNASRTMLYRLASGDWDRDLTALFRIPDRMLPAIVDSSGVCGETDPELFGFPTAHRGYCGRSAGGLVRAGMCAAGHGEEHLWDRSVPAPLHRRNSPRSTRGLAGDGGVRPQGSRRVCPGRQRVHRGRGDPVAPGRPRPAGKLGRIGHAGGFGAGYRRGAPGPGVRRAGQPALGSRSAGDHHRSNPRYHPGPPGPGRPRGHRVQLPGAARGHGGGDRCHAIGAPG